MALNTTSSPVYTDVHALDQLRAQAQEKSPAATIAVAKQFESLFIQMMLKSMREASAVDDTFSSEHMRFYQELFDKQIAINMSERSELGIADLILRQLGVDDDQRKQYATTREKSLPIQISRYAYQNVTSRSNADTSKQMIDENAQKYDWSAATFKGRITSKSQYFAVMRPYAEAAAKILGVDPEVLLAQSALESGWGKHVMKRSDGSSSHNLFGIKADSSWEGPKVLVGTLEYRNGVPRRELAKFRAYSSFGDSFIDYAKFIRKQPRYHDALRKAADSEQYVKALQAAGYATDPYYAKKILKIMSSNSMRNSQLVNFNRNEKQG